jgi:hypothetical protein
MILKLCNKFLSDWTLDFGLGYYIWQWGDSSGYLNREFSIGIAAGAT